MLPKQIAYDDVKTEYVDPFKIPYYFYSRDEGFISWRMGTGYNVELLHIRSWIQGIGSGRNLMYHMFDRLEQEVEATPYHSVYGFTRISNTRAIGFYEKLGFAVHTIPGIYADGQCALFHCPFNLLLVARDTWRNLRT